MLQQNKQISGSSAERLRVLDIAPEATDVSTDQLSFLSLPVYSHGPSTHMNVNEFKFLRSESLIRMFFLNLINKSSNLGN